MTAVRKGLPELPRRFAGLPVDKRGYPVPWFVEWSDGEPDHRIARHEALSEALRRNLCWLCGQPLGRNGVFVIGPMCVVNRTSSEPPSHKDCAEFAVKACPFLTRPAARRRDANLPEVDDPAGEMITRNPGVSVLWTTRHWTTFRPRGGGILVRVGDPTDVSWWREGRPANREECIESIEAGIPALIAAIGPVADRGSMEAKVELAMLDARRRDAMVFLPEN